MRRPRRTIGLLAGLVLTLGIGASAAAFDLDSLLIESVGGPDAVDSIAAMKSYMTEGSIILNGVPGRFTEYFRAPNSICLQIDLPGFGLVQGFDGSTAWRRDHNGQTSILSGPEETELLNSAYFSSFSYLLTDRMAGNREYRGLDTIDGMILHEVAFYPGGQDSTTHYYDTASSLLILLYSRVDEIVTEARCSEYRRVGGIIWPFRQTARGIGVPLNIDQTYDKISINEPIDDSIFTMPAQRATDFRFPAGEVSVTIPVDYHAGHIRVPATINGHTKAWFILDSGASANMLNRALAENLGLEEVGRLPAKGMGGYEEVALVRTDSIAIGDLTLLGQVAGSLDLSQLGRDGWDGRRFGGVLGYDFLSRFPILIDYEHEHLIIYDPTEFSAPAGAVEIPFHLTMAVPTVVGHLEGIEGDYIVDLGNPFGLIVHPQFSRKHDVVSRLDNVRDAGSAIAGIGGTIDGRTGFAELFSLGEVEIRDLTVLLAEGDGGLAQSEALAGNIGNLVLEQFRVLLDYSKGSLYLYDIDD